MDPQTAEPTAAPQPSQSSDTAPQTLSKDTGSSANAFLLGVILVCCCLVLPLLIAVVWSNPALRIAHDSNQQPSVFHAPQVADGIAAEGTVVERQGQRFAGLRMETRPEVLNLTIQTVGTLHKAVIDENLWTASTSAQGFTTITKFRFSHNGFMLDRRLETQEPGWLLKELLVLPKFKTLLVVLQGAVAVLDMHELHELHRVQVPKGQVESAVCDDGGAVLKSFDSKTRQVFLLRLDLTSIPFFEVYDFPTIPVIPVTQFTGQAQFEMLGMKGTHILLKQHKNKDKNKDKETDTELTWFDLQSRTQTQMCCSHSESVSLAGGQQEVWQIQQGQVRHFANDGSVTLHPDFGNNTRWVRCMRGLVVVRTDDDYVIRCDGGSDFCGPGAKHGIEDKPGHCNGDSQSGSGYLYFPRRETRSSKLIAIGALPENKLGCFYADGSIDVLGLLNAFHLSDGATFSGFSRGTARASKTKNNNNKQQNNQVTDYIVVQESGLFEKSGFVHEAGERLTKTGDSLFWTFCDSRSNQDLAQASSSTMLQL
jgi:hypothetical protein